MTVYQRPKTKVSDNRGRITVLSVVFLIIGAILIGRLFDVQILRGAFYAALAADQHEIYKKLFPERGSILVQEKAGDKTVSYPLVTNRTMHVVYAIPKEIVDATTTAEKLLEVLGLSEEDRQAAEDLAERLRGNATSTDFLELDKYAGQTIRDATKSELINVFNQKEKSYFLVRERLEDSAFEILKGLQLKGVGFNDKSYRFYTEKSLGGQLFGFLGYDGNDRSGKYGLEGYYDQLLAGRAGEIFSEQDVLGNVIALGKNYLKEKVDGANLVLTINRPLQYQACQSLKKSLDQHKSKSGSVIVMEPSSGKILAMCSFPDYDPNEYNKVEDASVYNVKAINDAYEPGSIFKAVTMAAAIDSGAVLPSTTYTDTGVVDYTDYKIRNFENKSYGLSTMTNVLEYSINTGVIFAMRQMTTKVFTQYVKTFGFGDFTGIDLFKETTGNISNLSRKGEINTATATFGQGISVTPIQMLTAFSAIINGGKLMKPYVVDQIIIDGQIKQIQPQEIKQVISPKTSLLMKGMLVSVVENGHAKKAQIPGWRVGGKTGTAQVPDMRGGYKSDDSIIGSFVGFAPFENPRLAVFVRVDEPIEGRLGETVAAPVFTEVAKFALEYYNVPHDK
ncbi:MAG: penicillin-binding protein 2 [Patescibacteria group bacterium]|jgi:cell division protein FtsI/penicillin-binding protein 2